MKQLLLILFSLSFLTACAPTAFVAGGAAAGSKIAGDSRSLQTISDDEDAAYQANSRLSADPNFTEKARVTALVFDHEMLLVGQAPTAALKEKAENMVKSIPEIKKIYNQIALKRPLRALEGASDAMITTNVKTRMLTTTNLKSNQFKVVTEDNVVYLLGLTTRKQAAIAVEIARNSTGVKRVVTLFKYTD